MRTLLLFVLISVAGQLCYGQARDESVHAGDPIKFAQVYPNPAVDYVSVKFESPVARTSKLSFHSIIGNTIELEQEELDDYEIRIKVKDLPVGYYIIAIHDPVNNARSIYKFLKK